MVLGVVALVLGLDGTHAFLLGAQYMAERQALVRCLDAVETLGATTFICISGLSRS